MTTLKDDSLVIDGVEVADSSSDSYSTHLQFLEQFFKVILEGIDSDAFEALNSLIVDVYAEKGIDGNTKLDQLSPEDYPIFDDLYRLICKKVDTEKLYLWTYFPDIQPNPLQNIVPASPLSFFSQFLLQAYLL